MYTSDILALNASLQGEAGESGAKGEVSSYQRFSVPLKSLRPFSWLFGLTLHFLSRLATPARLVAEVRRAAEVSPALRDLPAHLDPEACRVTGVYLESEGHRVPRYVEMKREKSFIQSDTSLEKSETCQISSREAETVRTKQHSCISYCYLGHFAESDLWGFYNLSTGLLKESLSYVGDGLQKKVKLH